MSLRPGRGRLAVLLALLVMALPWAAGAAQAQDWPRPSGHLGDYAQVVEDAYQPRIEALGRQLAQKTGLTVVLATLPSLDNEPIERAAPRLHQAWVLGPRGALVLVAVEQHRVRIELGQGLMAILDNAQAGQVRDKVLVPHLRQGRYGQGLHEGLAALARLAAQGTGVELEGLPRVGLSPKDENPYGSWYLWGTLLALVLAYAVAKARRLVQARKAT